MESKGRVQDTSKYKKAQIRKFIQVNNLIITEDVQNVLKELFADTLLEMLEAELDDSLGYPRTASKRLPLTEGTAILRKQCGVITVK